MNTARGESRASREAVGALANRLQALLLLVATAAALLRLVALAVTSPLFGWGTGLLLLLLVAGFAQSFWASDKAVVRFVILFVSLVLAPPLEEAKRIAQKKASGHSNTLLHPHGP